MASADQAKVSKVLLHQLPKEASRKTPSSSPLCLKLESYLRMAKIPYENEYCLKTSQKGMCPWIEYKGEQMGDGNSSVLFLNEKFHVDLDSHLSQEELAIAHAFKAMMEENTYWTVVYDRYVDNYDETHKDMKERLPWYGFWVPGAIQSQAVNSMHHHGIGRHSREEIYSIAKRDLKAVSDFLGEKKFLMGEKPSLVDCTLFGLVANLIWQWDNSPQSRFIRKHLKNLEPFCERMKVRYYPDWDKVIQQ